MGIPLNLKLAINDAVYIALIPFWPISLRVGFHKGLLGILFPRLNSWIAAI